MTRSAKIASRLLLGILVLALAGEWSPAIPAPVPPAPATAARAGDQELYRQAFGSYAAGRYRQADEQFAEFLARHPGHRFAAEARFWQADGRFREQRYAAAIEAFEELRRHHPDSPRQPEILLKIVAASLRLGDQERARRAMALLTRDFPQSEAARKAQTLAQP